MAIIKMIEDEEDRSEALLKSSVNHLLKDSIAYTDDLKDLVATAPAILEGFANFRSILRAIKRGSSFDAAVKKYATVSCPPMVSSDTDCDEITCELCWKKFCRYYTEKIIDKEEKGSSAVDI